MFNNYAENARHTAFAIKQMTSDTWKEVDQWNVINPMIGSVIDSYTYDQKTKDTDESVLNGNHPPSTQPGLWL